MAASLVALGAFFYLKSRAESEAELERVENLGPLPLAAAMTFIAAFSIGFGPLPWVMNSELFSIEAKV